MLKLRRRAARLLVALCLAGAALAAPPLTTIQDTLYNADGTLFNGVLYISWQSFTAADTTAIGAQSLTLPVTNGFLNVQLVPTTNALIPMMYTVRYYSGGRNQFIETWAVPPSSLPVRLQAIRTSSTSPVSVPPAPSTSIQIGDVTGLSSELSIRPTMGSSFAVSRAAIIDALGSIDGASGNSSDCVHVDGSSGPCGSGGGGTLFFSDNEVPSGTANGVNPTFTLANPPTPPASASVFRNGMLLRPALDYSFSGATITFAPASIPQASDYLQATYRYGGGSIPGVNFVDQETPGGAVSGTNSIFTLVNPPNPASSLALYRNGLRMKPGIDYTLSGNTITFLPGATPQPGDILIASYRM